MFLLFFLKKYFKEAVFTVENLEKFSYTAGVLAFSSDSVLGSLWEPGHVSAGLGI